MLECIGNGFSGGFRGRDPADLTYAGGNIGNPPRAYGRDVQVQCCQALDDADRRARFPGKNRLGPQRQNAFVVDAKRIANTWDRAGRLGIVTVFHRPDDAIAGSSGKRQLGEIGRQTDDASNRRSRKRCVARRQ